MTDRDQLVNWCIVPIQNSIYTAITPRENTYGIHQAQPVSKQLLLDYWSGRPLKSIIMQLYNMYIKI